MKKLLTILVLVMLIISFFQITSMYALYKEQLAGDYSTLLGVWAIKVNGSDISSGGQNLTFTIADNQLGYIESEYIQADKIAPGGQAYFDILIDPSNTDVSLIYTMNIEADVRGVQTPENELAQLADAIELIRVENKFGQGNDGSESQVENQELTNQISNSYTGMMPLDKITQGYKNCLRVYFKWKNVEDNNEGDSAIGIIEGATILPKVQINIKQYTGEVIGSGT